MVSSEDLQKFNDGLNQLYQDKQRFVATRDEIVMMLSLEYHLFRPSEVKAIVDELVKQGVLTQKGDYIRLDSLVDGSGKIKVSEPENRKSTASTVGPEDLQKFNDGLNQFYQDYGKYVTTRDELLMVLSLEYKLFRPSEARAVIDELVDQGILEKKGDYIRFDNLIQKNGKVKIPGTNNRKRTFIKKEVKTPQRTYRQPSKRESSTWNIFRRSRIPDEPMPETDSISDEDVLEDEDDYWNTISRQQFGVQTKPFSNEKDRLAAWDNAGDSLYDYEDGPVDDISDDFEIADTEIPRASIRKQRKSKKTIRKPSNKPMETKYTRKRTPVRGKGYMMIPDDGKGNVPTEYLETIQAKRSPRSIRMDAQSRSQTVFANPPKREDGVKWIRHPNRYDIQGIDTPKEEKPYKRTAGSKQTVLFNRKSKRNLR